jgi:hypothetical protein
MTIRIRGTTLEERLDGLLIEWHEFTSSYRLGSGHRAAASVTRDYATPTHHDWRNGAEEARAERLRMHGICQAMDAVPVNPRPWRYALQAQAKQLATGARGPLSSILLPEDDDEMAVLLLEARNKFAAEVMRRKETIG